MVLSGTVCQRPHAGAALPVLVMGQGWNSSKTQPVRRMSYEQVGK
jgi:hypothetical protein